MNDFTHVRRHEHKYYLSFPDYVKARRTLRYLMESDGFHEMGESYFIRSLYFDDTYNTAINDKLAGIEFRDKFRLRTYDTDLDWLKLERKSKANEFITKTSEVISREQAEQLMTGNYSCLIESDNPTARMLYVDFIRGSFRPVVLIDYEREAYTLPFNNIRVTFDKNIRSNTQDYSLFDDSVTMKPILPADIVVLEVKYNHFLPGWFKTALQLENPLRAAVSKYTLSRLQTGDFSYI